MCLIWNRKSKSCHVKIMFWRNILYPFTFWCHAGDGRLLQWGCGRACGNMKENILLPEEVTPPGSPVREIAGGCWHSMLLTGQSLLMFECVITFLESSNTFLACCCVHFFFVFLFCTCRRRVHACMYRTRWHVHDLHIKYVSILAVCLGPHTDVWACAFSCGVHVSTSFIKSSPSASAAT